MTREIWYRPRRQATLNLNVHFHTLMSDGVDAVGPGGAVMFHPRQHRRTRTSPPSASEYVVPASPRSWKLASRAPATQLQRLCLSET
jgi:hypothetical protein